MWQTIFRWLNQQICKTTTETTEDLKVIVTKYTNPKMLVTKVTKSKILSIKDIKVMDIDFIVPFS